MIVFGDRCDAFSRVRERSLFHDVAEEEERA